MAIKKFLNRREAAQYMTDRGCKTSWRYLQKQACTGGGPIYQLYNNHLAIYTPENLDKHIEEKLSPPRRSTSEVA